MLILWVRIIRANSFHGGNGRNRSPRPVPNASHGSGQRARRSLRRAHRATKRHRTRLQPREIHAAGREGSEPGTP